MATRHSTTNEASSGRGNTAQSSRKMQDSKNKHAKSKENRVTAKNSHRQEH